MLPDLRDNHTWHSNADWTAIYATSTACRVGILMEVGTLPQLTKAMVNKTPG